MYVCIYVYIYVCMNYLHFFALIHQYIDVNIILYILSFLQIAENTPENTLPGIEKTKISEEFSQFRNEMFSISNAMNDVKNSNNKNDNENNGTDKMIIETGTKVDNTIDTEKIKEKDEKEIKHKENENLMEMKMEKEMEKEMGKDDEELVLERFEFPLGSVIATVEMMFVAEEEYMTQTKGDSCVCMCVTVY